MGGGPLHEHLLIVLFTPKPAVLLNNMKSRFPYLEITYIMNAALCLLKLLRIYLTRSRPLLFLQL
jgi:hypothetical protein